MTITEKLPQSSSLRHFETLMATKESPEDIAPNEIKLEEDKYERKDSGATVEPREDVGKSRNGRKHGKGLTEGDNGWYLPCHAKLRVRLTDIYS